MPTDPEQYQKSLLPWSRWKHALLINYIKAMVAILRSWKLVYYVDGFAGPGVYTVDDAIGSPVLAARHAQELAHTNAEYSLRCINVELNDSVFENLERSTAEYSSYVTNRHGEFAQFVVEILKMIGDRPTLFFLDPIGLKGLEWQALLPIFRRSDTTEILVRFDAQTATRLTGNDTSLNATFNSILGEDSSNYWQGHLENCDEESQTKHECLTKAYEVKLALHFPYVGRIPIMSEDDSLKYYLLFATRSLKGMQVMNDVVFGVQGLRDRTLDEQRRIQNIPVQIDMFEPREEDKALHELESLKQEILEAMGGGARFKRDELRGLVASLGDNFGRFSTSQFTAVLGGIARRTTVPEEFNNLKDRIEIHNEKTLGVDTVEISLKR